MRQRLLILASLAFGGFAFSGLALALGFGSLPDSIPFGQALDLTVPVRLDSGESLVPGCVQAQVQLGEQRLAPGALRVTLEQRPDARGGARVRIRAAVSVQEPVVTLDLTVGCNGAVSRRFVFFADPADRRVDAPGTADAAVATTLPTSAAPDAALPPPARRTTTAVAAGADDRAASGQRAKPARQAVRGTSVGAAQPRTGARPRTATSAAGADSSKRSRQAAAPRLRLEEPEQQLEAAALAMAAQGAALVSASQAASAAQAAASAAEQRLSIMESSLKLLQEQAAGQRATIEQMRSSLTQAEERSRVNGALVAVAAALAALALWLGSRLRSLQRQRQAAWWQGGIAAQGEVLAGDSRGTNPAPGAAQALAAASTAAPAQAMATSLLNAAPGLLPAAQTEGMLLEPAGVDQLIDLEQEAEFFVVLGEEQSAVDLLMAHLRSSGGAAPLPYLKLLEIHHRRGEREAHERLRQRFEKRFGAVAPEWNLALERGRELQDHPAALVALQGCWHQPTASMAVLEDLLLPERCGEIFALPAYRDVLTLYLVARDLSRRAEPPLPEIDVLLPLEHGDEALLSAPASIFDGLGSGRGQGAVATDARPGGSVDLDLDEALPVQDSRAGELAPLRVSLRPSG
jgi:hypothetical protein